MKRAKRLLAIAALAMLLASAVAGSGDFGALDARFGDLSPDPGREATTVSGPVAGKVIVQLLTQTS